MKIRTIAFAAIALSSASAFATAPSAADGQLKLTEVAAHMESHYSGDVVAIQFDPSGDKRPHYHVDMRFPQGGLAMIDVDAVTLEVASREPVPLAAGAATLPEVVVLAAAQLPGQVTVAELDSTFGVQPHYDVDVRLPHGAVARLKIDPETRQIAWRNPAIVEQ
jgi:uncharacterized membrane protein YkoI